MHVMFQVTKMPIRKRLCSLSKEMVNQVLNYFLEMEKPSVGRGALTGHRKPQVREFCGAALCLNVAYVKES